MPKAQDPFLHLNFALEVQGISVAMFKSVSGLESTIEVSEVRQQTADGKQILMKIPGKATPSDITFSRGMDATMDLWNWHKEVLDGHITNARKSGSVVLYDEQLQEKSRWNFENAWPSKISMSALDAGGNEMIVEELTLTCDALIREK
ncbi:MAG TPA: phage tail protein [Acidimicrobiales bacterium]|jgi:phage tail-like protein|nr:phage tail protein [Acidimicrobiales bacterium]